MRDEKTRELLIDNMKGYGTILVFLGHSFLGGVRDTSQWANWLFNVIYCFHMPLFFLINGYLLSNKTTLSRAVIWKKFSKMMIPYYWGIISVEIIKPLILGQWTNWRGVWKEIFLLSGNGWFLSTLFLVNVIVIGLLKYDKRVLYLLLPICLILSQQIEIDIFRIDRIVKYLPYYVIGIMIKRGKDKGLKIIKKRIIFVASLFIILIMGRTPNEWTIINFFISFCGIYCIYYLSAVKGYKVIEYFGQNSIMALTIPNLFLFDLIRMFLDFFNICDDWLIIVFSFILQVIGSILILQLLKKSKLLSCLYGVSCCNKM